MARSINQIYNELISTKESITELNGLTSTSATALWKLYFFVVAVVLSNAEKLYDIFRMDLEEIRRTSKTQTALWWNFQMKNVFQFDTTDPQKGVISIGSDLIPRYEVVDDTKKIIKFSSTKRSETSKVVNIKVARDNGSGQPQQLSQEQLSAAISFSREIQGVGDYVNTVSFKEDIITGELTIYYNGMYVESTVKTNVQNAITAYLQNVEFDGKIIVLRMIDFIQEVAGVKNIVINSLSGTPDGGVAKVFTTPDEKFEYVATAGYSKADFANLKINMVLYS